jgi:adenosine 3'-phospho 5'-phosphosulfate transporter B3
MAMANLAALRLTYATEVLFKSSKLIPVMIGNIIFLNKRPKLHEVMSVVLIVTGLIGISLGDHHGKNKFDAIGVAAVIFSLCSDAIASNLEEKIMSTYGASQSEIITIVYGVGAVGLAIPAVLTGQMASGTKRLLEDPTAFIYLFLFAFLGAVGIQFVYLLMKVFGSLLTVMVTSVRKAVTVLLSFIVFRDKKFTVWHGFSIFLITAGMAVNIYAKKGNGSKRLRESETSDLPQNGKSEPIPISNTQEDGETTQPDYPYNKL